MLIDMFCTQELRAWLIIGNTSPVALREAGARSMNYLLISARPVDEAWRVRKVP